MSIDSEGYNVTQLAKQTRSAAIKATEKNHKRNYTTALVVLGIFSPALLYLNTEELMLFGFAIGVMLMTTLTYAIAWKTIMPPSKN